MRSLRLPRIPDYGGIWESAKVWRVDGEILEEQKDEGIDLNQNDDHKEEIDSALFRKLKKKGLTVSHTSLSRSERKKNTGEWGHGPWCVLRMWAMHTFGFDVKHVHIPHEFLDIPQLGMFIEVHVICKTP